MDKSKRTAQEHLGDELADKGRDNYKLEEKQPEEGFGDSLKLDLTPEQEQTIATDIITLADQYDADRKEWVDQWKEVRQWYEDTLPEKSFPWEGCSNYHDPLILKTVNGIDARISQVIFGNGDRKIWTFKPVEKSDIEGCKRKEKYIDYVTVVEMKFEETFNFVRHDANLLGNGFLALTWLKDEQRVKDVEIYDPANDAEVAKRNEAKDEEEPKELTAMETFLDNFPDSKSKYPEFYNRLKKGERLELKVSYNDKICNAPKSEWVKPEDMIANRYIIEPERQPLYGRWKHFTKNELQALGKSKYFQNIDELFKLEAEDKDKPEKADTKIYDVAEVCYLYDADGDGVAEKNMFWIEKERKLNLRGIAYPFDHMKPFITPVYFEDTGDEFYRKGNGIRLKNLNATLDSIVQQALDSNAANFPVFENDDPDFNPSLWQFYPLCTLPKGTKQVPIQMTNMISDGINLSQVLSRKGDDVSGLSSLTTGRESQTDPNAPAAKTAMLLQQSGINLSKGIKTVKLAMREIGFQIAQLEYQFGDKKKEFRVLGTEAFENITSDDMRIRGDFVPAGSLEYTDPNVVFQKNKFLYEEGMNNPIVKANPVIQAELWRNLVISTGDIWEMQVDILAPTPVENLQMMDDFKTKMAEKQREIGEKDAMQQALKMGKTPEEAKIIIAGLFNNQTPQEQTPPAPQQLPMSPQQPMEGAPNGPDQTGQELPPVAPPQ